MTIAHVISTGSPVSSAMGTTSITVAYPATGVAGQIAVLMVNVRPETATWNTPAGWTKIGEVAGGDPNDSAASADQGRTKLAVFVKILVGGETGNVTITNTGGTGAVGAMSIYSKAGGSTWDHSAFGTGTDTIHDPLFTATSSTPLSYGYGDALVASFGIDTDLTLTMSNPKLAMRVPTVRNQRKSTSGNDEGAYSADIILPASGNTYVQEVLADSPYWYWKLDESAGPTADDASPNNRDGTYHTSGITYAQSGPFSGQPSLAIAKVSASYIQGPNVNLGNGQPYSVEFWARRDAAISGETFLSGHEGYHSLAFQSPALMAVYHGGGIQINSASVPNETGIWRHYVVTFDGVNNLLLYVDGVQIGSNATAGVPQNVAFPFYLGDFSPANAGLIGSFDDFALYRSVLSPARIQAHLDASLPAQPRYSFSSSAFICGNALILRLRETIPATPKNSSDVNGPTVESATLVVKLTSTDVDGANVENATVTVPVTASDSNGVTVESQSVAQKDSKNSSDTNGTTTESATLTYTATATDADGANVESATLVAVYGVTDSNGVVTESVALVAQLTATDVNGPTVESQSVAVRNLVASSDANGATTESAALVSTIAGTDVNGPTVESQQLVAQLTTTDVSGVAVEAQSVAQIIPKSGSDTSDVVTEITTLTAQLSSADTGTAVESASVYQITPKSGSDTGTATEAQSLVAKLAANDASGTIVESQSVQQRNAVSGSDTSGVATENVSLVAKISVADSGTVVENQSVSTLDQKLVSDSGTATETASVVARVSSSDTSIGLDSATVTVNYVLDDFVDLTSIEDEQLVAAISDSDYGTAVEEGVAGAETFKYTEDYGFVAVIETATVKELLQTYYPIEGRLVIHGTNGNLRVSETGGRTIVTSGIKGRTKTNGARSRFRRIR